MFIDRKQIFDYFFQTEMKEQVSIMAKYLLLYCFFLFSVLEMDYLAMFLLWFWINKLEVMIILTGVCAGELRRSSKHTACGCWILLVVIVEGIRSMVSHGVGLKATTSRLNRRAIRASIATSIVKSYLQSGWGSTWACYAPTSTTCGCWGCRRYGRSSRDCLCWRWRWINNRGLGWSCATWGGWIHNGDCVQLIARCWSWKVGYLFFLILQNRVFLVCFKERSLCNTWTWRHKKQRSVPSCEKVKPLHIVIILEYRGEHLMFGFPSDRTTNRRNAERWARH